MTFISQLHCVLQPIRCPNISERKFKGKMYSHWEPDFTDALSVKCLCVQYEVSVSRRIIFVATITLIITNFIIQTFTFFKQYLIFNTIKCLTDPPFL